MSNLNIPIDFLEKKGSELFKVQGGFAFKSDDYSEDGYFLVRIGNVGKGRFDYKDPVYVKVKSTSVLDNFLIKENDVLMGLTGDLGKICFVEKAHNLVLNQRVARFLNDEKLIDKKYLYYLISSEEVQETFESFFAGGAQKNISPKKIEEVKYLLPSNIKEQKKIAEILTKVDESIENTEQLIQKYEQVKVGLMQGLLTKGIDENGNIRSEETHQFKDSPLGRIPLEWDCDKLDTFLSKKQYGISLPLTDNGKYSVLRMNNIKYGELFLKDVKYTSDFFPKDLILKEGDVLFNRTNSIEHVGRTGIFRKQEGEYTFASYLVRLSPNEKLNCEFLNLLLNFNTNQERIKAIATSAVHQANVNPTNLGRLYFSIPKYDEQILIFEHLQKMTKLIIHNRQLIQKLQLQKQGLMQDLLSGKVRVNY